MTLLPCWKRNKFCHSEAKVDRVSEWDDIRQTISSSLQKCDTHEERLLSRTWSWYFNFHSLSLPPLSLSILLPHWIIFYIHKIYCYSIHFQRHSSSLLFRSEDVFMQFLVFMKNFLNIYGGNFLPSFSINCKWTRRLWVRRTIEADEENFIFSLC